MSIPVPQSGLRAVTPYNLVLDAGIIYKNINMTQLRNGLASAYQDAINPANTWVDPNGNTVAPALAGATKGGTAVDVGKKERPVMFDSRRTNVKGLTRTDEIAPFIKTRLLEVGDVQVMNYVLGSINKTAWTNYQELVPSLVITDADYIGNIALVAPVSGSSFPMVVVLENAKVMNPSPFDMKDKDELAVEISFIGHSLASNQYAISIHFFVPTTTSGSTSTTPPTLTSVNLLTVGGTALTAGATGIAANSNFYFNYSEALDNAWAVPGTFELTNATTGADVPITVIQTAAGNVNITPSSPLTAATTYIIADSTLVRDTFGNRKVAKENRRFTTT
jgi:hypothetical protein